MKKKKEIIVICAAFASMLLMGCGNSSAGVDAGAAESSDPKSHIAALQHPYEYNVMYSEPGESAKETLLYEKTGENAEADETGYDDYSGERDASGEFDEFDETEQYEGAEEYNKSGNYSESEEYNESGEYDESGEYNESGNNEGSDNYDGSADHISSDSAHQWDAEGYLTLVNRDHPVDKNWDSRVNFVSITDDDGDESRLEERTYQAYQALKQDLANEGIVIGIGSAYRSVDYQQQLADRYEAEYGHDYVEQYVAKPGYSEHHTGLAIDLRINYVDGCDSNPGLLNSDTTWSRIHDRLADYGFILRYPAGKEDITGISYEQWHIRFVGEPYAREIAESDLTLEEYLAK